MRYRRASNESLAHNIIVGAMESIQMLESSFCKSRAFVKGASTKYAMSIGSKRHKPERDNP